MKILATLFLILSINTQIFADTKNSPEENLKEYDIEIIIFEDAHARYINSEEWPHNIVDATETITDKDAINITSPRSTANLKKADSKKTMTRPYKVIKPRILKNEYQRINGSSEYNVLFYGAWRQPGLEKSSAFEIDLNELENAHKTTSENSITGHLKVELSRYLHFYSQLEYQRLDNQHMTTVMSHDLSPDVSTEDIKLDVNNTDVSIVVNNKYPLNDHRRMRSKELHYIDHPLVGILVQINPVE